MRRSDEAGQNFVIGVSTVSSLVAASVWMDNDFIIPYPLDVGKLMVAQLQSATFYQSTLVTLLRSWGGLLAAFVLAGGCTTGGTDVLAALIRAKFPHYSVAQIMQVLDGW